MTAKKTTGAAKAASKPETVEPETVEPETVEPAAEAATEPAAEAATEDADEAATEDADEAATEDADEAAEERDGHPLTITDEATYHEVVSRYALPINGYELGGFNGVIDSRYELTEGQVIYLPWPLPEPTA